jgi:hypothetical protein
MHAPEDITSLLESALEGLFAGHGRGASDAREALLAFSGWMRCHQGEA